MKIKQKIAAGLLAVAATTGLTLATTIPAEAVTMSRVQHCNWPQKATVQTVNHTGSWSATAYSPTGWRLGSVSGSGNMYWHTPWEDVNVFVYSADGSYYVSGHCRY